MNLCSRGWKKKTSADIFWYTRFSATIVKNHNINSRQKKKKKEGDKKKILKLNKCPPLKVVGFFLVVSGIWYFFFFIYMWPYNRFSPLTEFAYLQYYIVQNCAKVHIKPLVELAVRFVRENAENTVRKREKPEGDNCTTDCQLYPTSGQQSSCIECLIRRTCTAYIFILREVAKCA